MLPNKLQLAKDAIALLPAKGDPIEQDEYQKFGNWTGQGDVKAKARDLLRRGLKGADQLVSDPPPNPNDHDAIRNTQSDWKTSAIEQILANARKRNLRTPEEINANRDVLISNPRWRDAINNSSFQTIHPNFWEIITHSILPEQYAKYDKMNADNIVKK